MEYVYICILISALEYYITAFNMHIMFAGLQETAFSLMYRLNERNQLR